MNHIAAEGLQPEFKTFLECLFDVLDLMGNSFMQTGYDPNICNASNQNDTKYSASIYI